MSTRIFLSRSETKISCRLIFVWISLGIQRIVPNFCVSLLFRPFTYGLLGVSRCGELFAVPTCLTMGTKGLCTSRNDLLDYTVIFL